MKFQLLLATFIVYPVSLAPAQEQGIQHHVTPESDEAGRGGSEFTIHNSDEARPLYLQPLDPTAADFGIEAKISRSRNEKGSAANHYEKGMLYKRAGNHLYNQSRYKQAYRFYEQAETELSKAAEKHDKDLETKQKRDAYYHLGLVCEKIRNDKSIAANCFAKARELDPSANHLAIKLARTKEGRERLGVTKARQFSQLQNARGQSESARGNAQQGGNGK